MNRRFVSLLLALIGLLLLSASASPGDQTAQVGEFDRRAMLENYAYNIILPLHETFLSQIEVLRTAVNTFQAAPTSENLEALQASWREASRLWFKVSLFRVGRITFVYHSRIANDVPIAVQVIDQFINGTDPLDASTLGVFGSNVVGLRTVEYLIFDPVGGNEAILHAYTDDPAAARRAQYLALTAEDLYQTASELLNMWSPEGANYAGDFVSDDDPYSVQESISMLVNQMIESFEMMVNETIGWPLGTLAGTVQPGIVEARYSGYSIQQITSHFEMLRDAFNGQSTAGDGPGFDDYLDLLGASYGDIPLSDAINGQIDAVLAALAAIDEPLEAALLNHPERVQRVYDEGRKLVVLMKADMTSQLGITITFSDADGD